MMNFPAEKTQALKPAKEKQYSASYVVSMCAILMVLIVLRAIENRLVYLFIGVSGVIFLLSSPSYCVTMLFFLMPFSFFLKPNTQGMTFFTILFFLTVLKMVLTYGKISLGLFLSAVAFFVYHLIFSGTHELKTVITIVAGSLMLYYIRHENICVKTTIFAFIAGICLSSLLALLGDFLPQVNVFLKASMLKIGEGEYQNRFSGFVGNPNYYTMSVVMTQAALLVFMHREKNQLLYIIAFSVLSVFGFMSVSKSFLVVWIILVFFWLMISIQKGISGVVKFVFVGILILASLSFFAYDYLEAFAYRLFQGNQDTLSNLTSGRTDILLEYFDAIFTDMKILFFGKGTNVYHLNKNAHNTYIECIFYFGLFGTTFFCAMLKTSMQKIITAKIMWIPVLILMIRMLAIGIIAWDDLWFLLGLLVLLAEYCAKPQPQMQK